MTESDEVLVIALAYCLSWEIAGARANQHWAKIHNYIEQSNTLSETERWICELYEESSPTAQEERSVLYRMNLRLHNPRVVLKFRQEVLQLLPESIVDLAAKHRLMNPLTVPRGYGPLRTWLAERNIKGFRPAPLPLAASAPPTLAAREADFLQFIEFPYFLEAFRRYWHRAPKNRNNKQTRILLTVAAALGQMMTFDSSDEIQEWCNRLAQIGSYTEQTQLDVADLCLIMVGESYDAHELAYRLLVDAQKVDRQNVINFCERYADDLTGFAREFVRGMQLTS
ncbi:hypothetical protein QEH59_11375 [Coraliomargarita sp. SDUM461004]|uniref:Uncharacterized protein n=1 Tax=Thalassobacterium sedimentorum TaxID=3041258 RepID=A0ABU1AJU9_9BACT|nr:hypothetical protein [Coraliomargarita sp. SDUM461004]MDQ8195029.1 hypothetical protein [Coraliomargarita sp. SDUM461004]